MRSLLVLRTINELTLFKLYSYSFFYLNEAHLLLVAYDKFICFNFSGIDVSVLRQRKLLPKITNGLWFINWDIDCKFMCLSEAQSIGLMNNNFLLR